MQIIKETIEYRNPHYAVRKVRVAFDGFQKEYFVVDHGERVGMIVARGDSLLLVRQYRFLIDGLSWEIPGGGVDAGETPLAAAVRECQEETGVICHNPKPYFTYQLGLDVCRNPAYLFHATDFEQDPNHVQSESEVRESKWVPSEQIRQMMTDGRIADAHSLVALSTYFTKVRQQRPATP